MIKSEIENFNLVFNLKITIKILLRGRQENAEILEQTRLENEQIANLLWVIKDRMKVRHGWITVTQNWSMPGEDPEAMDTW